MKIYDELIKNINNLISSYDIHSLDLSSSWLNLDEGTLVFKNDSAFELGEGLDNGLSGIFLTSDKSLVDSDEVILVGDDLSSIKENTSYARIVFVRVNDSKMGTGNQIFQNIRKIDYTRYHINPEGFMLKISPFSQKESVRVSKSALKEGISFSKIGKLFIDEYKKQDSVEACKIIFVSLKEFDFNKLEQLINKSNDITKALDHLVNKVKMDCHSCKLQVVCQEVENLVKEDFSK